MFIVVVESLLVKHPDTNPLAVAMVSLPVLNIVAMGNPVAMESEKLACQRAASQVLKTMEECLKNQDNWEAPEDDTIVRKQSGVFL